MRDGCAASGQCDGKARGRARGSGAQKAGEGRLERGVPVGRPDRRQTQVCFPAPESRQDGGAGGRANRNPWARPEPVFRDGTHRGGGQVCSMYRSGPFQSGACGAGGKRSPGWQWAPLYPGV